MTQSVLLYKKHKPLISIITVVLNNRVGLELTAASVVNQICFSNMEWIVIDGGSTDGGVDVLKSYQDELTYWVSEPDGGIYEAMNKGLMHANGEYVLFLNAGDALCSADVMTHVLEDTRYGKVDYLSGNIYYTIDNEVIGKSYSPKVVQDYIYLRKVWGINQHLCVPLDLKSMADMIQSIELLPMQNSSLRI
ncbi:glycosyltransferase [Bacteroides congonensis]